MTLNMKPCLNKTPLKKQGKWSIDLENVLRPTEQALTFSGKLW